MTENPKLPYDEIGADKLSQLVDTFYGNVANHPKLKPIFPDDLTETARKQKQFLTQYLGGPNLYTEEHGHPMMKMRHNPFPITPQRAEAWLACMSDAMDKVGLEGKFRRDFYRRLELTANHMVNEMNHEEEKNVTRIQIPSETIAPSFLNKPIEMYIFLDPLCSACWDLQPIIRKLQVEYGQYFTIRTVLSTQLNKLNSVCNKQNEQILKSKCDFSDLEHPVLPSIAVKAAEFQGKRAALRFFNKIQEHLFLKTKNVTSFSVLQDLAKEVNIDVGEFTIDFQSKECARSFQNDLSITSEMQVTSFPSIVFFNENIEDEGIKVSGIYPYEIYVQILQEMLYEEPQKQQPPTLEKLFYRFHSLTTSEIACYYNISEQQAERELKKRLLLQEVEKIVLQDTILWRLK